MTNDYTALINAQAAQRHAEAGNVGDAIEALTHAGIYFGQALQDGSLKDSPYDPENEILKARLAVLRVVAPEHNMIPIYENMLQERAA